MVEGATLLQWQAAEYKNAPQSRQAAILRLFGYRAV
jgi:hypothetical protein